MTWNLQLAASLTAALIVQVKVMFRLLEKIHGKRFQYFFKKMVCSLVGCMVYENFSMEASRLSEMTGEINITVSGVATSAPLTCMRAM
ncbi:unnamed protein product [Urochloa humidicola]